MSTSAQAMDHIYLSPRARTAILWISAGVVLLFLWQVRGILDPLVWAAVTVYALNPVVIYLARRTGLSRRLWAGICYVALLGLLVVGLIVFVPIMAQQLADLGTSLPSHLRELGRFLGVSRIDFLGTQVDLTASDAQINSQIGQITSQVGRGALPAAIPFVAEGLLKLLLYLVSTFFLMVEAGRIGGMLRHWLPANFRAEWSPWVRRINKMLGAYISGQLILVLLMAFTCYVALAILDVKYAPLLAVFSGLVLTVPYIGPYIGGGASVLVALTQGYAPFGWSPIVLGIVVALAYTVLRNLESNFVMPFVIGRLVDLHPLTVIFVVLAGAAIAGVFGLLVAVPVATTVKIIAEYLYKKLRQEPPRTLAIVEPHDSWSAIAARIREAAQISKASGASRPRLLVSVPVPPEDLLDPAQFHRLVALLHESKSDAILVTRDSALLDLAHTAGIHAASDYRPEGTEHAGHVHDGGVHVVPKRQRFLVLDPRYWRPGRSNRAVKSKIEDRESPGGTTI